MVRRHIAPSSCDLYQFFFHRAPLGLESCVDNERKRNEDSGIDICSSVQSEGCAKRSGNCFLLEVSAEVFVPTIISLLFVVTLPLATISAHAAELAPMVGLEISFRTGASALIYYTEGVDGDHVVTTVRRLIRKGHHQWRDATLAAMGLLRTGR